MEDCQWFSRTCRLDYRVHGDETASQDGDFRRLRNGHGGSTVSLVNEQTGLGLIYDERHDDDGMHLRLFCE